VTPGGKAGEAAVAELCAVRVGEEEYLIDLRRVREIVTPLPVTPVPRSPEFVDGVCHLRGEIVPVVDVRKRLGVEARPLGRRARFVLVRVAGQVLALAVDAVTEVLRVPRGEIRPAAGLGGAGPRFFLGVCAAAARRGPGRLRLLLNVKALLEPEAPAAARAERERVGEAGGP
jgi:purine-binding chemotaxis protein CheW